MIHEEDGNCADCREPSAVDQLQERVASEHDVEERLIGTDEDQSNSEDIASVENAVGMLRVAGEEVVQRAGAEAA